MKAINKNTCLKFQPFALALLIIMSTLVSLFSQLTAYAATPFNILESSLDNIVKSAMYFEDVIGCMTYGTNGNISFSGANPNPSSWFDRNKDGFLGNVDNTEVYVNGNKSNCGQVTKDALVLWGWGTSYDDFLGAVGCTKGVDSYSCSFGNDTERGNKTRAAILKQAYVGQNSSYIPHTSLSKAAQYVEYFEILKNKCQLADIPSTNETQLNWARLNYYKPTDSNNSSTSVYDEFGSINSKNETVTLPYVYKTNVAGANPSEDYASKRNSISYDNEGFDVFMEKTKEYTEESFIFYGHKGTYTNMSCRSAIKKLKTADPLVAAYSKYLEDTNTQNKLAANIAQVEAPGGATSKKSCEISGVGWIVCPVVNFLGGLVDSSWNILTKFLETSPSILGTTNDADGSSDAAYKAWQVMRNIANVLFVIAFLIIIFSQMTSFGVSNYGIKKLLPKLIISVILVNLSFYLCKALVDVSNIIGYSLRNLFVSLASQITSVNDLHFTGASKANGAGIVATILLGGAGFYAGLAVLIPALLGAIVALAMILFILVGRQALIILLAVLSPVAFVAFLLPNTEKLFEKWKTTLTSMLLLFPIVALVMGASELASKILLSVATKGISDPTVSIIGQIAATAVAILPLFIVPGMLKKALDGVGGIGAKINNLGDKWSKGAGNSYTNSGFNKYRKTKKDTNDALTRAGAYAGKNPFRRISSSVHRGINKNSILNGITNGYGDSQSAAGLKLAEAQKETEIAAASSQLKYARLNQQQKRDLAAGNKVTYTDANGKSRTLDASKNANLKSAAIRDIVATNDVRGMNELWDASLSWTGEDGASQRTVLADSLQSASGRPAYFGQGAIASMRQKAHQSTNDTVKAAIDSNVYSAAKIAAADKDELSIVANVAATLPANSPGLTLLKSNAADAVADPILGKTVAKNITNINKIITGTTANPLP